MTIKHPLWLFLLALATSWVVIGIAGFDGLYGQDSFHYLACSRRILATPDAALRPGSCYWPLGYPLLEALFILLSGAAPLGAQLASTVTAAALAPLVYWLALESTVTVNNRQVRERIAIAAGLLMALCGQRLLSSIVVMSDAPALFWGTLAACALLRWARAEQRGLSRWLVGCAVTLAIAAITRWIYAGLLVPFGVFASVTLYRWPTATSGSVAGVRVTPMRRIVAGVMPSLLLPAAIFLLIFLPQLYLSQHSESPALSHGWLVGWNPLNAVRTSFDNPDGHFDYRFPPFITYAMPLFHPFYLAPLLTPFVFLGAWQLRRSTALLLLGGWIVTLYGYLAGVPSENSRFPLAFFPPVAVLAALGLWRFAAGWRSLFARGTRDRPGADGDTFARHGGRTFWLLLTAALIVAAPFTYRNVASLLSAKAREVSALRYLQAHTPPDALIVTFGLSATLMEYSRAEVIDLFAQTPATLRPVVCSARPVYLYVERGNIESQWTGKSPAINVHWLQEAIGLETGGDHDTWTLYRVRRCSL